MTSPTNSTSVNPVGSNYPTFESKPKNLFERLIQKIFNFVNSIFSFLSEKKSQESAPIKNRVSVSQSSSANTTTKKITQKAFPKQPSKSPAIKKPPVKRTVLSKKQPSQNPQFNKENIQNYLTSKETTIFTNIESIINRINETEDLQALGKLEKALQLQIKGLRPTLQETAAEISASKILEA